MVSLRNNEENEDEMSRIPMEELAELEARMAIRDATQKSEIDSLRADIKELMDIVETLKGFFAFVQAVEKFCVFVAKAGAAAGVIYAIWKFGIGETIENLSKK